MLAVTGEHRDNWHCSDYKIDNYFSRSNQQLCESFQIRTPVGLGRILALPQELHELKKSRLALASPPHQRDPFLHFVSLQLPFVTLLDDFDRSRDDESSRDKVYVRGIRRV